MKNYIGLKFEANGRKWYKLGRKEVFFSIDVKVFHLFSAGKYNYMYLSSERNINYIEIILEKYRREEVDACR